MSIRNGGLLLLALSGLACNNGEGNPDGGSNQAGLGASCAAQDCRHGLVCNSDKVCVGGGATKNGGTCTLGVECQSGNCAPGGIFGLCANTGMGASGTSCTGDSDCAAPLKCGFDGERLFPVCLTSGNKDVGAECKLGGECAQGLICVKEKCTAVSITTAAAPHGVPPFVPATPGTGWQGPTCPASKTMNLTALWEVPRDSDPDTVKQDFYRLPFPNDALRDSSGKVDFSRHPRDPNPPFGFDVLGRYLEKLTDEPFSNAPTVIFRFEGQIKFESLSGGGNRPVLSMVKLSAGPGQGNRRGIAYKFSSGGNRYVCGNWLAVRPYLGDSLEEGTYAVVLLKGVQDVNGNAIAASADFASMIASTAPTDTRLTSAYTAYAPLRAWLSTEGIAASDVVTATVFTVGDPQRLMKKLKASVDAAPAPTSEGWVKCGSGAPSPCADVTGERACGSNSAVEEWHGLISVPIFQTGAAPYLTPAQGGSINAGEPVAAPVRTEKVCAALTVPLGTAPTNGWPLVIYAHGTGGSFRSHVGDGSASALSSVALAGVNGPMKFAVLGFDQVGHGPRRGPDGQMSSPNDIVFNFANPASARGTMAQGGADLHAVTRWAKAIATTPAPGLPRLDPTHLVYWGHSQGATEGALFLAQDRSIDGTLLTGASASLVDALTTKRSPINIADNMWIALSESDPGAVDRFHPVLGLLQSWIDQVDPLHFAKASISVPANGTDPAYARHVFQVWGKSDTFTASSVQASFAMGAGLAFIGPKVDDYENTPVLSVSGNFTVPRTVTAAMRQYTPSGYDGHFVAFLNPTASADAVRFVARVGRGDVPTIPEP